MVDIAVLYDIEIDGVPWSETEHGGLIQSIEIEDEEGANLTANVTVGGLTIDQMGSSAFRQGVLMRIKLGYPSDVYDWGIFRMSKPQYTFGPNGSCTVTLTGQSGRSGSVMTYYGVNESFEGMSAREIIEDIAKRYGYSFYFGIKDDPPVLVGYEDVSASEQEYFAEQEAQQSLVDDFIVPLFEKNYAGLVCPVIDNPNKIPIYEGGIPDIDTKIGKITTNGRTHFQFLKDMAESRGRVLHIHDRKIIFISKMEDNGLMSVEEIDEYFAGVSATQTPAQDPYFAELEAQQSLIQESTESFAGGGITYYSDPAMAAQEASALSQGTAVYSNPGAPIHFIFGEDPRDNNTFSILSIRITENFRNKAGGVQSSIVNENTGETETKTGKPTLADWFLGTTVPGNERAGVGTSTLFGWGRTSEGENLKVNPTPETRDEITAEQKAVEETASALNAATSGQAAGYSSAGDTDLIASSTEQGFAGEVEAMTANFLSTNGEDGLVGGDTGTPDELGTAVQSAADADQYGVFIEFETYGQPGAMARQTIYLENLSRWSGKTYMRYVRHRYDNQGYIMSVKARAPGTGGVSSSKTTGDQDNPSPDNANADSANLYTNQLVHVGQGVWDGGWNRTEQ